MCQEGLRRGAGGQFDILPEGQALLEEAGVGEDGEKGEMPPVRVGAGQGDSQEVEGHKIAVPGLREEDVKEKTLSYGSIAWIMMSLLVLTLIGYVVYNISNPPELPSLEETIKFCEDNYHGTVREWGKRRYCVLPNGNECELKALYGGYCLDYLGAGER